MKVRDRILVITDLMLGALFADATMTGEEDRAVRELLAKLLLCRPDALPEHVDARIRSFSLLEFDIEVAARDFLKDPPMKKRRLLELIASLTDKDGTDFREDEYLRDLAQCLDMQPDEYADIVLSYEIESMRESFDIIRLSDEISAPQKTHDPEDDLPRWRRKALRQRRESEKQLQAQKAEVAQSSAAPSSAAPSSVAPSSVAPSSATPSSAAPSSSAVQARPSSTETTAARDDEPTRKRPKTIPPPIPASARKKA